jgi:hypothetical protein
MTYSSDEETTNCQAAMELDPLKTNTVVLSDLSDGTTLPALCNDDCKQCQLELLKFSGSLTPQFDGKQQAALFRGMQELNAFSPWLGRDCNGEHCAKIEIDSGESRVSAKATIKVPLFSKSLVNSVFPNNMFDGKDYLELHYSSEETFEREKAKS